MSNMPAKGVVPIKDARDQPIDPKLVAQAESLAAQYRVEMRQESSGFVGKIAAFPSVLGHGSSRQDAIHATRELLKWAIAYLIETGRTPTPGK